GSAPTASVLFVGGTPTVAPAYSLVSRGNAGSVAVMARLDHEIHVAHHFGPEEPLHRSPRVAGNAEQHLGRGNSAIQVVVEGRQADADFIGEGLGLVCNDLSQPL